MKFRHDMLSLDKSVDVDDEHLLMSQGQIVEMSLVSPDSVVKGFITNPVSRRMHHGFPTMSINRPHKKKKVQLGVA